LTTAPVRTDNNGVRSWTFFISRTDRKILADIPELAENPVFSFRIREAPPPSTRFLELSR
jgi:hypothetical protein